MLSWWLVSGLRMRFEVTQDATVSRMHTLFGERRGVLSKDIDKQTREMKP